MIALRRLRPGDRDMIRRWRNQPEIARHMYTDHEISEAEHAAWFDRVRADPECAYWIITSEGCDAGLAGITGIDHARSECSWAFYLADESFRGRGIGAVVEYLVLSHVFDTLGLETLRCEVLDVNAKVAAMHKRFGFREDGLLHRHIKKGDVWHDVIVLAMSHHEWQTARPEIRSRLAEKGLLSDAEKSAVPA